uniref:Uncharacterized protein n=1 Tax=Pan paniscus TaxID=9597 RepID=A0A2R9AMV4_PANPA
MNVVTVEKPSVTRKNLLNIIKFTVGSSLTNVMNVVKLSLKCQISLDIKEFILERSPMHVRNVRSPSRNLMNVMSVEKHSARSKASLHIRKFILGRNLMHVMNVVKPSLELHPLLFI